MPVQGWPAILDEFEAHILAAESLISSGAFAELAPWQPPVSSEPLPRELVDRARELASRQEVLLEALTHALEHTAKMRDLATKIVDSTAAQRPAFYIDTKA